MGLLTRAFARRPEAPAGLSAQLAAALGCPVLGRVYAARGTAAAELSLNLKHLHAPELLDGVTQGAVLLADALAAGRRLLVVADYDADGATACAVAVRGLRAMGATVDFLVPDRLTEGYGLTPAVVRRALALSPGLIITVDQGVASVDGVALAAAQGVPVLVTDHHLPGPDLPAAAAIVNPNLHGARFPSRHLAGVGVMFYLLLALRAELRRRGAFAGQAEPNLARLLDLVALGTVADVVQLDANNRVLVAEGLRRISAGQAHPGVLALLGRQPGERSPVTAADLGFRAGPRLNAAGRLQDMSLGIACLLSDDPAHAQQLAAQLDTLNRQRREVEAGMQADALAALEGFDPGSGSGSAPALCVYQPGWHIGVVGLLAGRLRERYGRPVVALADAGDGELRGSARSIAQVHVRDALAEVAALHPGLLTRFGGHAMAAGLTMQLADLPAFSAAFELAVARQLGGAAPQELLLTDGALGAQELTLDLARRLRGAGPWGAGFPEPVFDGEFRVREQRIVGETHLKLRLLTADGETVSAIAFGGAAFRGELLERVTLAYRVQVNTWNDTESLDLHVEAIAPPAGRVW